MTDNKYARIKLTHAIIEGNPVVHVILGSVAGYHHSPKLNCTYVYCMGQNVFPAKESCEEIDRLIDEASKTNTLIIS